MERQEKKKKLGKMLAITVMLMIAVSAMLLFILSIVMYKMALGRNVAEIVIILVYVIVGVIGGFLMGRYMRERRFLWGLAAGAAYFFVLLAISLAVGGGQMKDMMQMFITMILCLASSMIGGMAAPG